MDNNTLHIPLPTVAICGWSGSGKTWLLENLIQRYTRQGYAVGIVKHDAHHLEIDHPGKNSYRLWHSGANALIAHDDGQWFLRGRKINRKSLKEMLVLTSREVDFVLVEGHKDTHLPKIWLDHPQKPGMPDGIENVISHLSWGDERLEMAEELILNCLCEQWKARPVYAGILVGGQSRRMGYPKHSMEINGQSILQSLINTVSPLVSQVVLLGELSGLHAKDSIITLPDIQNCVGPLAGMLSAFRWNPDAAWIFIACDMPNVRKQTIEWLLQHRIMGKWGVIPKDKTHKHPLLAVYESQSLQLLESAYLNKRFSILETVQHSKFKTVEISKDIEYDWFNCNTPEDMETLKSNTI